MTLLPKYLKGPDILLNLKEIDIYDVNAYRTDKAVFDFSGNIMQGKINSRTAVKLVREWIDLHREDLEEDWKLARTGKQINKIAPLD